MNNGLCQRSCLGQNIGARWVALEKVNNDNLAAGVYAQSRAQFHSEYIGIPRFEKTGRPYSAYVARAPFFYEASLHLDRSHMTAHVQLKYYSEQELRVNYRVGGFVTSRYDDHMIWQRFSCKTVMLATNENTS